LHAAKEANVGEALMMAFEKLLEEGEAEAILSKAEWFEGVEEYAGIAVDNEPKLRGAMSGNECHDWLDAIKAELTQIEKLNSWDLVILPLEANIVPSKYVFQWKQDAIARIIRFKARLVAKGFKQ